jgi:uncharacterized repeat protein (TIGR01451 family)
MSIALRSSPRALALKLALVAGVLVAALVLANPAQAQVPDPGTGASAGKNCLASTATPGQTIICAFAVANTRAETATVTALTETSPFPGGAVVDISCTIAGGTVIDEGDILPPNTPCLGTVTVTIPDDPTLCGTVVRDRVDVELEYRAFTPPLTAGAFATFTTDIVCPADISVTKTAEPLSKVGDAVNYTITVRNEGEGIVNRVSVIDTLVGDITAQFPATLAPGASFTYSYSRVVAAGDPDPLINTVTAIYGTAPNTDTATATATTNLFQPSVDVTKTCTPAVADVGDAVTCTIVITDTSSDDAPQLVNGMIEDSLTGNLLAAVNPARVSSTCTAALPDPAGPPGSCTIVTRRTVVATDPDPVCNKVTVRYNPTGFPNVITDSDEACVPRPEKGGEGCTPGFWKQDQHFDSWVTYEPGDFFEEVFGVEDVTVRAGGQATIEDPTLLEALNATGGEVNALARHAVAALLNASNPDVEFDFTPQEVIDLVQEAFETGDFERIKDILAEANEQGCPLS